jgi:ubiquinone/menaquinone biosynthesis C-methylase UbiE
MSILNGFDRIALFYDQIASMVFGRSIINSQLHFIDQVPPAAKILILGGGTGWIAKRIVDAIPDCEIWYIEASSKMLTLSRSKTSAAHTIHFIHGTENDIPASINFDVVITNFYLDMFSMQQLKHTIEKIHPSLNATALWLVTDFVEGKLWQRTMLKMMYTFFRLVSHVAASSLPDWNYALQQSGMKKRRSKFFYGDFIESCVFSKS